MSVALAETRRTTPQEALTAIEQLTGSLVDGRNIMCPACETWQDVLTYRPLEHSVKYSAMVVVPMKCRRCSHVFALRP